MQIQQGNNSTATQYLVVAGSHAYGTSTVTSDFDLRGWAIPPRSYFLTFDKVFHQTTGEELFKTYPYRDQVLKYATEHKYRVPPDTEYIDHCIYDIRKFFDLGTKCNPSLIENLFVRDEEVLVCTEFGKIVRDNRELFLSARAKHTFSGYAVSQLKRINTHRRWLLHPMDHKPTRDEYGLSDTSLIPSDQRDAAEKLINDQVREWLFQDIDEEAMGKTELAEMHAKFGEFISRIIADKDLVVRFLDENQVVDAARVCAMRKTGMTENYIAILQSEKRYRRALTEWNQYQTWKKNRNPERAKYEEEFGYDLKHAMQLVRLLLMGKRLLVEGVVEVYRHDAADLLAIKRGSWTYNKVIEFLDKMDKEMTDIYDNKKYVVPYKPNINALSELCESIVMKYHFD